MSMTRKLSYRKDYRAMCPIYGTLKIFESTGVHPWLVLFLKFLMGFCSDRSYENLKFVALPIPEIIGGTQKIWICPCSFFSKILIGLFGWTLWTYQPSLKSVAFLVPEIIAIEIFWGCEPPILGNRRPYRSGSALVPFERALVTGEFLHSKFSCTFTRFRGIAAFLLQHDTFSHPTCSLPKISLCSPGSRWMAFGLRRAKVLG